jgi:hypothetical protein
MQWTTPWTAGRLAAATVALAIVSSSALAQDFTVRMKSEDDTISTTYVSRNAIRKTEPGFKVDVIYRLAEGKIIYVDHEKKTYSEVTLAEARQKNAKATAAMSPQQKEMMRRMGLDAAPAATKLGAGETIAGYATEKYVIKTPMMEMEISAAPALIVPPAYYDVFTSGAGGATVFGGLAQFSEAIKKINGMILKQITTTTMNKMTLTKVATSVDKSPIPSSTFEPPAGYKNMLRE